MHRSKSVHYSITSSAREISGGGMVTPIAFAVFRLKTNSNGVGCSTGRSAGFAPLRNLVHVGCSGKLDQHAVAGGLDDPATMRGDGGIDEAFSVGLEPGQRALLIDAH